VGARLNLVASMICRNEAGRYLDICVAHLLTFCDAIYVLDDGSDDGTFEWLDHEDQFFRGVRVARNPGPSFFEHEGRARQNLYDFTVEDGKPDYVLAIDADEFVSDPSLIRKCCERGDPVYTLSLIEIWHAEPGRMSVRVDGLWGPRKVPILFRPESGWKIRPRQLACGREPQEVVRLSRNAKPTGSKVLHMGWARAAEREARAARYDVHDGGRFHQDRHLQSILWEEQGDRRLRLQAERWPVELRPMADALAERTSRPTS